jgi:hypothetical protein
MIRDKKISQSSSRNNVQVAGEKVKRKPRVVGNHQWANSEQEGLGSQWGKERELECEKRSLFRDTRARGQLFYPIQKLTRHLKSCLPAC